MPSVYTELLTTPAPRGSDALFWPLKASTCMCVYKKAQCIPIKKKKKTLKRLNEFFHFELSSGFNLDVLTYRKKFLERKAYEELVLNFNFSHVILVCS